MSESRQEFIELPDYAYEALTPLIKWARTLNHGSAVGYRKGIWDDVRETYRLRTGDVRRIGELFDRRRDLYEEVVRATCDRPERPAASLRRRLTTRRRLGALLAPRYICAHGKRLKPISFNVYAPCGYGCGTTEPERWWHRLGWWATHGLYDPFGRSHPWRRPW